MSSREGDAQMATDDVKGLEALVEQRRRQESKLGRELAAAASAARVAADLEKRGHEEREAVAEALSRSERLAAAEAAAGVTAGHMAARATHQGRLASDLAAAQRQLSELSEMREETDRRRDAINSELVRTGAQRKAAEERLGEARAAAARRAADRADEEASEQAAARRRGEEDPWES